MPTKPAGSTSLLCYVLQKYLHQSRELCQGEEDPEYTGRTRAEGLTMVIVNQALCTISITRNLNSIQEWNHHRLVILHTLFVSLLSKQTPHLKNETLFAWFPITTRIKSKLFFVAYKGYLTSATHWPSGFPQNSRSFLRVFARAISISLKLLKKKNLHMLYCLIACRSLLQHEPFRGLTCLAHPLIAPVRLHHLTPCCYFP